MATLAAYTKLDRVGRGSYDEVWKALRHSDGTEVVLKEGLRLRWHNVYRKVSNGGAPLSHI